LASPVAHVWFFKGLSSALPLILDMAQKSLESVIYYASYLITDMDDEKKKKSLLVLGETIEKRKADLKKELEKEEKNIDKETEDKKKDAKGTAKKKEQQELIIQEFDLQKRQKVTRLSERYDTEAKKMDEIQDALFRLIKSLRIGSVLSEDEYFKILEYDIPVFFTIKTGTDGLLELLEKIDMDQLIINLRKRSR
jgi:DNA-directed RNA polymerase subunit beta'